MRLDNKFFHYEVGDKTFHNNVSAFQFLTELKRKVPWADSKVKFVLDFDFMKNSKKYNWQVEPKESFSYYMEKTAMMFYEKYKNIMLWYSGGTDSHPIAETFARLGIPIHLMFCDMYDQYSDGWINARTKEWKETIKPVFLKWANECNKKNKIIDFSEIAIRKTDAKSIEELLSHNQFVGNYNSLFSYAGWNLPEPRIICNNDEVDKKIGKCSLTGYEKPWIVIEGDWWCHTLNDGVVAESPKNSPISSPFDDTYFWFYINDFVPELHIKATWNKINAIEKIIIRDDLPLTNEQVGEMQNSNSKYYKEINDMTEYKSITVGLSLPGNKSSVINENTIGVIGEVLYNLSNFQNTNNKYSNQYIKPQKMIVNEFWENHILKTIDSNYINLNRKIISNVSTNPIRVKKLYK